VTGLPRRRSQPQDISEIKIEPWFNAWGFEITVERLLGSIPESVIPLRYWAAKRAKELGLTKQQMEELVKQVIDELRRKKSEEEEEEEIEELGVQKLVFRYDPDLNRRFIEGYMIIGCLAEAIQALNLSRKYKNVKRTFWVEPERLYLPNEEPRWELCFVKGITPKGERRAMKLHECYDGPLHFKFYLISTQYIPKEDMDKITSVMKRIGLGSGRTHGYTAPQH